MILIMNCPLRVISLKLQSMNFYLKQDNKVLSITHYRLPSSTIHTSLLEEEHGPKSTKWYNCAVWIKIKVESGTQYIHGTLLENSKYRCWILPLAQLSSSPLSIRRYLGLSGNHGRNKSWANAGIQLLDSNRGQCFSPPNNSLWEMWEKKAKKYNN